MPPPPLSKGSTYNPNPQPRARFFDVFNSASTGHQVADGGGARGREWRITRQEKLARQFGSMDGDCTSSPVLTPVAAAAEGIGDEGGEEEEAGRGEWVFAAAAHSDSVCSGNNNNSSSNINSNYSNNVGAGSHFAAQKHSQLRSAHNGPRHVQLGVRASSSSTSTGQMDIRNMLGGQVRKRGYPEAVSDGCGGGQSRAIGMKKAKVQTQYSLDWATEIASAAAAVTTTTATKGDVSALPLIPTSFKPHPTPTPSITSTTTTTTTIKKSTTPTLPSKTSATTPSTSCETIPPSLHIEPMNNKKIFSSLTIHINGQTTPLISDHALKRLLVSQGATLSLSLSRKITHVIIGVPNAGPGNGGAGGGLAASKIQNELQRGGWKGVKIVGVQW
ncbi:uncharacterized protein BO95DRAFT_503320 [Aspergillus brunneoviolaceus CBS 621.78]|uniref:Uncharacterized protein n=1 Tax=Aspergillus brunneoviolaceus CBS 621.78 TaxID=1450534 RepID=A0ACD1GM00_9EURO|nr:hypothetical protein BO95DRAFT_503320 [Aspergillus brunneoviolaceus CBS 621.78]RAH50134.1 hypothetical protein BO95DRAFT_503320 [Aspergillus brunneoviolaceus CBS 621.78]